MTEKFRYGTECVAQLARAESSEVCVAIRGDRRSCRPRRLPVDPDTTSAFEHFGLTPVVREDLTHAASAIRQAIAAVQDAFETTEVFSDAEYRCSEAIAHLEQALYRMVGTPPGDN